MLKRKALRQEGGSMQLTLGPVLFHWEPGLWRDFYYRIADEAPVDTVVVGEAVCSKRMPFYVETLPAVVERLTAAGKTVILASLALVTLERERRQTAELAASGEFLVEANDLSCLAHLAGRPHAIGPLVNVYNEASAAFCVAQGAARICLPPELPLASVALIAAAVPETRVETFAFGRVPLAISARCYHARLHKHTKDNCRFVCAQDADGLMVETLDGEPFLAINGVQTLSQSWANLAPDVSDLSAAGVAALRLSPQSCDMVEVARVFRRLLDGADDEGSAMEALGALCPGVPFSNGFIHARPGAEWRAGTGLPEASRRLTG
jgi:collagenase-like PrtC family protease